MSKDECTCTRLYSVVLTWKRPFTEELLVLGQKTDAHREDCQSILF